VCQCLDLTIAPDGIPADSDWPATSPLPSLGTATSSRPKALRLGRASGSVSKTNILTRRRPRSRQWSSALSLMAKSRLKAMCPLHPEYQRTCWLPVEPCVAGRCARADIFAVADDMTVPKEVVVITGPPGCGKSDNLRLEMAQNPGRYLYFAPTIPLIEEQAARLRAEAPHVRQLMAHSRAGKGAVARRLKAALARVETECLDHVVVYVTHDTLISHDFSAYRGWHARIDETPNAVKSGVIRMGLSRPYFQQTFELIPSDLSGWSELRLKDKSSWVELAKDQMTSSLVDFHKQVGGRAGVFVHTNDWSAINTLEWISVWTPASLQALETVHIASASYLRSVGAKIALQGFGETIRFIQQPIPYLRSGHPRVKIHYFTAGHSPSSTLWECREGRRRIKLVCDYLAEEVPSLGFWSGNDEVIKLMDWRLSGDCIRPKVSGQNSWRKLSSCAFIYSSGSVPEDAPLKKFLKISDQDIKQERESEDVFQFVMRGALRERDFQGGYDIYLYNKQQASTLRDMLKSHHVSQQIELVPIIEPGLMDLRDVKSKPSEPVQTRNRPARVLSATGRMILPKSARRNETRQKQAGGTPKKRGRPRKSDTESETSNRIRANGAATSERSRLETHHGESIPTC
jgi:hypothetical protein